MILRTHTGRLLLSAAVLTTVGLAAPGQPGLAQGAAAFPRFFQGPVEPGIAKFGTATLAILPRSAAASFQFSNFDGSSFTAAGGGLRRGSAVVGSLFRIGGPRIFGTFNGTLTSDEIAGRVSLRRLGAGNYTAGEVPIAAGAVNDVVGAWASPAGGADALTLSITDTPNRFSLGGRTARGKFTVLGVWAPLMDPNAVAPAGAGGAAETFVGLAATTFRVPKGVTPELAPGQPSVNFGSVTRDPRRLRLNLGRDTASGEPIQAELVRP